MSRAALLGFVLVAACGGSDTGTTADAADQSDAPGNTNKVQVVTCTGTPPTVTVMDGVNVYMPMQTVIAIGGVVEFKTSVTHDVKPALNGSDPGLNVGFSADVCLKFTEQGTYGFYCTNHGFTGSVVVNPNI